MASPAVALPNGVPTPSSMHPDTGAESSPSITAATKRKRESSDDDEIQLNGINSNSAGTPVTGIFSDSSKRTRISKDSVRNYYLLLERCDTPSHPPSNCHAALPLVVDLMLRSYCSAPKLTIILMQIRHDTLDSQAPTPRVKPNQ
jgi:hypothetical protein